MSGDFMALYGRFERLTGQPRVYKNYKPEEPVLGACYKNYTDASLQQ